MSSYFTVVKTFTKEERLTSKKIITKLFEKGKQIKSFPIKLLFLETDLPVKAPVQIVISVPKKNFPKATDRNLLKRKIREAYRLNKEILFRFLEKENKQLALMLVFSGKKHTDFPEIEKKIILTLQELIKK